MSCDVRCVSRTCPPQQVLHKKVWQVAYTGVLMTATATTPEVTPEAEEVLVDITLTGISVKEQLYEKLHQFMASSAKATKDGRVVIPKSKGRDIALLALNGFLEILYNEGKVALPGGNGSLQLRGLAPRKQRTPQGKTIDCPARWVVRYNPGVKVDERIKKLSPPTEVEIEPEDAETEAEKV